ncbi:MAG: TonB family protein [Betaproteobacteria bacterium]|nr:TonB family protein [Betaproteobacteria bacterium]
MSTANSEVDGTIVMSGWAQKQRQPGKHLTGIIAVSLVHGVAFWMIMTGAGQKFVKAVVPSSIVEVVLPPEPPPPPPPKPPEPPKQKLDTPPPPPNFVPPPEVAPPTTTAPVIEAVQTPPPPPPVYVPQPPQPVQPPRPVGPRGFGSITNRAACVAAFRDSFPREARRAQQEGSVTISARIGQDGRVIRAEVVNSNPRRVFDRAALNVLNSGICKFDTDTAEYDWQAEISYKLSGESAE